MFTEAILRKNPTLVKALTGVPDSEFWLWFQQLEQQQPAYEQQRHQRPERQRAFWGGRPFDQPLLLRVLAVLTYLRLHVPQAVIALMFGCSQADVSRDLRRLLPLIQQTLPCPQVWQVRAETQLIPESEQLVLSELSEGRVLVDATEQRVARPQDHDTRKQYYSGKKKQFTLKTQCVSDSQHHIQAISTAEPGAMHDKALSDALQTLAHLPDQCEAAADRGYQGLAKQVSLVTVREVQSGAEVQVPRLTVQTPFKKPRGQELTVEQKTFNQQLNAIRVRIEHCIGWAKNWAILATRFRCAHAIYTSVMQTVCGLVNWQTQRWQAKQAANCA